MSRPELRNMCRTDLEDEVMLERAHVKALENEIYSLRQQLAALTCACCDPLGAIVDAGAPPDAVYWNATTKAWGSDPW